MYVTTVSRPNVACAVGKLSQRCANPTVFDWKAVKRIFRYLLKNERLKVSIPKDRATFEGVLRFRFCRLFNR